MNFSIIIPTFNRRNQIGKAIESILAQTGVEFEIIIVDDGSSDGTIEWLAATYPDSRIRVLQNRRKKGPAGARNTGLLAANGEFIALLDSDDEFLENHLAGCLDVFKRHSNVGLIFGRAVYEQNGQPVDYMGPNFDRKIAKANVETKNDAYMVFADDYFNHLLQFGCYFNLSTVAIRQQLAKELMNEQLRIAEDYEFWVRLSRKTQFASLNAPQIRYQLHEQNISFEAATSIDDNAPQLIKAHQILLDYPDLNTLQRGLIKSHLAQIYFDWAYRCRQHRQYRKALSKHIQSLKYGSRTKNMTAIFKLLLLAPLLHQPKTNS